MQAGHIPDILYIVGHEWPTYAGVGFASAVKLANPALQGRLSGIFDDFVHPREQLIQIVIAAVRHAPRHRHVHVFAAVAQFGGEDGSDGVRGVAVFGADADAPVHRRGFVIKVVQRVHHFYRVGVCLARALDRAVCRAVGGEVARVLVRVAKELVFAAREVKRVEGGRGFLPPHRFGVGDEIYFFDVVAGEVAVDGQPRVFFDEGSNLFGIEGGGYSDTLKVLHNEQRWR